MRKASVIIVFLAITLASLFADPPATLVETELLIEKIKAEMAREEEVWSKEKQEAKDAEIVRKERFQNFNQEKDKVREQVEKLETDIQSEIEKIESLKRSESEYTTRFSRLMDILLQRTEDLKGLMAGSIPYRTERREKSVNFLIRDIKSQSISPEEAFNRLWVLYENEHQLAAESEVYEAAPPLDGNAQPVTYLRLGKQLMFYASRDGRKLGYLSRDPSGARAWVTEEKMNLAEREAIRDGIITAEGGLPPEFRPIPIPASMLTNQE